MFNFIIAEIDIYHNQFILYPDKNSVVDFAFSLNIKKEVTEYST
jgi:hypothetical protein